MGYVEVPEKEDPYRPKPTKGAYNSRLLLL